jgi:hypothetical protein
VFLEGNRLANLLFSWNSQCVSRAGTQDRTPKSRLKKRLATYCIDVSREATWPGVCCELVWPVAPGWNRVWLPGPVLYFLWMNDVKDRLLHLGWTVEYISVMLLILKEMRLQSPLYSLYYRWWEMTVKSLYSSHSMDTPDQYARSGWFFRGPSLHIVTVTAHVPPETAVDKWLVAGFLGSQSQMQRACRTG